MKRDLATRAGEFGTEDFWNHLDRWWALAQDHRAKYGPADTSGAPMVGEADLERAQAGLSAAVLREEFRGLAGIGVPGLLRYIFTGELNTAELVGLDLQPLRDDSRGYCVPVGPSRAMSVGFQIRKPVSVRAGGELEYVSTQPTVDEVSHAIQVMMGWLVRNELLPGMEMGDLSPDEAELR